MSAAELVRRAHRPGVSDLSATELSRWLVDAGLAERTPAGLLLPTRHARELAASLTL